MEKMYYFTFIYVILCGYLVIAISDGVDAFNPPVRLDIHTKESTDKVNVTKIEEGYMTTYEIEPKNGYKVDEFTDGDKVIYETKDNEPFLSLAVKYSKNVEDEPVIVTFRLSLGTSNSPHEINYYLYKNRWKKIVVDFYNYITKKIGDGKKIDRDAEVEEYIKLINLMDKKSLRYIMSDDSSLDSTIFTDYDVDMNKNVLQVPIEEGTGKLVMGSFVNRQGILIRTYASRVENPKGHVILVHGVSSHFRSSFCKYNLDWYIKYFGEYANPEIQSNFDRERDDIFPNIRDSLGCQSISHKDSLHGKNAFDLTPRFLYDGSFVHVLNRLGYSVYGLDLQSHGLSGGICDHRCYVDKFDDFALDVIQFVSIVKRGKFDSELEAWNPITVFNNQRHDNNQYHLVGLSMGGNIVLKAQVLYSMIMHKPIKLVDSMVAMSAMLSLDNFRTTLNLILQPFVRIYASITPKLPFILQGLKDRSYGMMLCMRRHVS